MLRPDGTLEARISGYGPTILSDALLGEIGFRLLNADQVDPAIAVFKLNVEGLPASAPGHALRMTTRRLRWSRIRDRDLRNRRG